MANEAQTLTTNHEPRATNHESHIADCLAGVQRRSRLKNPLKTQINHFEAFMRNKPNSQNDKMNINKVSTEDYQNIYPRRTRKNKPNSNPIQSQYDPKQSQNKPNMDPKQTQSKPNQTQFQKSNVFSCLWTKHQKGLSIKNYDCCYRL